MKNWVADYIGIPFKVHGREPETGFDCWGLVRYVMAVEYGHCLPSLADMYKDIENKELIERVADYTKPLIHAHRVLKPTEKDLVLMRFRGYVCHVGIMVDDTTMLHTDYGKDSCIQKIRSQRIADRIEGYYRVV